MVVIVSSEIVYKNIDKMLWRVCSELWELFELLYEFILVKRYVRNNGCLMRLILRLDRVKLKYKVLDGVWSEEILCSEMVIMMFLNVVVNESRILRMEFFMYDINRIWDSFGVVEELFCFVML